MNLESADPAASVALLDVESRLYWTRTVAVRAGTVCLGLCGGDDQCDTELSETVYTSLSLWKQ